MLKTKLFSEYNKKEASNSLLNFVYENRVLLTRSLLNLTIDNLYILSLRYKALLHKANQSEKFKTFENTKVDNSVSKKTSKIYLESTKELNKNLYNKIMSSNKLKAVRISKVLIGNSINDSVNFKFNAKCLLLINQLIINNFIYSILLTQSYIM